MSHGLQCEALLRPEFTRQLAAQLMAGAAIALISPHGSGRRRTLLDLRQMLAGRMRLLSLDMKFDRFDCAAAVAKLLPPDTEAGASLFEWLNASSAPTLLILHNLDLLHGREDHDPAFDRLLLAQLPKMRSSPMLSLLAVFEADIGDWLPGIEPLPLPALTGDQIAAEVGRRQPTMPRPERERLANELAQYPDSHDRMQQLLAAAAGKA